MDAWQKATFGHGHHFEALMTIDERRRKKAGGRRVPGPKRSTSTGSKSNKRHPKPPPGEALLVDYKPGLDSMRAERAGQWQTDDNVNECVFGGILRTGGPALMRRRMWWASGGTCSTQVARRWRRL